MLAMDPLLREAQKLEKHLLSECSEATSHQALLAFHTLDACLSLESLAHDSEVDLVRRMSRLWKDASPKERTLLSKLIATRGIKSSKTEAGLLLYLPIHPRTILLGDSSSHA